MLDDKFFINNDGKIYETEILFFGDIVFAKKCVYMCIFSLFIIICKKGKE